MYARASRTLAKYASEHVPESRQIWYTPVEATFSFGAKDVIAFIGDEDPWSDVAKVKKMAEEQGITLFSYPDCNHSLETDDVDTNLVNLRDVMVKTARFIVDAIMIRLEDLEREKDHILAAEKKADQRKADEYHMAAGCSYSSKVFEED